MLKQFEEHPTWRFAKIAQISGRDAAAFLEQLKPAEDDAPVCWRDGDTLVAYRGVALCRGRYAVKHGSFVDPSDLSVYGRQYYVADLEKGRHDALQLDFGPRGQRALGPAADGRVVGTARELRECLSEVLGIDVPVEEPGQGADTPLRAEGVRADGDSEPTQEPAPAAAAPALKLLQPSGAFEMHGKLVAGWHASIYQADDEQATELIVFE